MNSKKSPHLSMEERKHIPATCEACNREFKNIFSLSAHKTHCIVLHNGLLKRKKPFDGKQGWSKDKILRNSSEVFIQNSEYTTRSAKDLLKKLKLRPVICEICRISEWCGKPITLELDHVNGDNKNHSLENIRLLCPNCHSQTPTWRGRNNTGKTKVSNEKLLEELKKTNIRQALLNVGLAGGGNYKRCKKLLQQLNDDDLQSHLESKNRKQLSKASHS